MGWKVRDSLDTAYEKAAYELEPSTTGNPKFVEVKSGFVLDYVLHLYLIQMSNVRILGMDIISLWSRGGDDVVEKH